MAISLTKEDLQQDLDQLTSEQLKQVADFVAFLKFQDKRQRLALNLTELSRLKTEFAQGDSELAEAGMDDYTAILAQEDRTIGVNTESIGLLSFFEEAGLVGCLETDEQLSTTYKEKLNFAHKHGAL